MDLQGRHLVVEKKEQILCPTEVIVCLDWMQFEVVTQQLWKHRSFYHSSPPWY